MAQAKVCCACGKSKPATTEYFYLCRKNLDKNCKTCVIARARSWRLDNLDKARSSEKARRLANADKVRVYFKAWVDANPDKVRAFQKAWRDANPGKERARSKAWRDANRDKAHTTSKAWRDANRDKVRAKNKAYHLANPEKRRAIKARRRALKRNSYGSHTAADIKRLHVEQCGLCAYCKIALPSNFHVDHVVPLSRGGGNGLGNICLACPRCNFRKGAKLISEMR